MTINQRLNEYFEFTKLDAPDFYKKIGVDRGAWSGWINSAKPIPVTKIQMILTAYPDLNARWLMVGEGEMLNVTAPEQAQIKPYPKTERPGVVIDPKITTYSCADCIQKEKYIEMLKEMIEVLKGRIETQQEANDSQKELIDSLKKQIALFEAIDGKNDTQKCG